MEQKPILIQGAMDVETEYLINKIENKKKEEIGGYEFYIGEINGYPVIISRTKIGIINATSATTIAILKYNPIFIINQGTAGATSEHIHRGDILIAEDCISLGSYITPKKNIGEGSNPFEWELLNFSEKDESKIYFKCSKELIKKFIKYKDLYKDGEKHIGRIASGDIWNNEIDFIKFLSKKYEFQCEEMESAGAVRVANNFKIPIACIRIISDNVLLEEEYDRNLGIRCQEYIYKVCKEMINAKF